MIQLFLILDFAMCNRNWQENISMQLAEFLLKVQPLCSSDPSQVAVTKKKKMKINRFHNLLCKQKIKKKTNE